MFSVKGNTLSKMASSNPDNTTVKPFGVFESRLKRRIGKTLRDFNLINEKDRIMVAVSGGKDSWSMLRLLMHFQNVSPVRFELFPVTIHPGFSEFNDTVLKTGYQKICPKLPWRVIKTQINKTIKAKNTPGKHPCAFCARLRRGALYRVAEELNCNKIALGHHADDAIETVFISSMFEGNMVSLPPRFKASEYDLMIIRPLIRVWEEQLIRYSKHYDFPIISCGHDEMSGGARNYIKELLKQVNQKYPSARENLLASLHKLKPGHFLDKKWL